MTTTKLSKAISLSAVLLTALIIPSQVRSQPKQSSTCEQAIQVASDRIEQGRGISVRTRTFDMSTSAVSISYPDGRPIEQTFFMEGERAADIMNSPKFMQTISAEIINACQFISKVRLNVAHTDWDVTFGLLGQGQVAKFQCIENPRSNNIPWGYTHCL